MRQTFYTTGIALCGMYRIEAGHARLCGLSPQQVPDDSIGLVAALGKRTFVAATMDEPGIAAGLVGVIRRKDKSRHYAAMFLVWTPPLGIEIKQDIGAQFANAYKCAGMHLRAAIRARKRGMRTPWLREAFPDWESVWADVKPHDIGGKIK